MTICHLKRVITYENDHFHPMVNIEGEDSRAGSHFFLLSLQRSFTLHTFIKMFKTILICMALLVATPRAKSQTHIDLRSLTTGQYVGQRGLSVRPIEGTDQYARLSDDGKQVVQYSFRTGKQTAVLFDADQTQGARVEKISGYIPSPDGTRMLVSTEVERIYRRSYRAQWYIYTVQSRKLEPLSTAGAQQSPVWSPDGRMVAFVRNNNIFLVKLLYDNAESQVTTDGKPNEVINGVPDWVNEEEFSTSCSMTFSADAQMLCWIRYDEQRVPQYELQLYKGMAPAKKEYAAYPGTQAYKYPKAGQPNAKTTVWSYDIKARKARQLDVPIGEEDYTPRILATSDPSRLLVCTMNRHQDQLHIHAVNPRTTVSHAIIKETVPHYVKEEVLEQLTLAHNQLLLPSDRDGHMRLYVYDLSGQLQRTVGQVGKDITDVYGLDERTGDVFYQVAAPTPMDRQVWVAHRNGKEECLTPEEGWNEVLFSGDFAYYRRTWSDRNTPYKVTLCQRGGKVLATEVDNASLRERIRREEWSDKEFFSFTTSEGVQLNGWMVKPRHFDANKRYPVILFQYSGPGSQQVVNAWSIGSMGQGAAFDQYLAERGFVVVCVDGRGTGGRGAEWEKCTYQRLGQLEARDQVETARFLAKQPWVDATRMGIWGWSFGGFTTLMAMSDGSGAFKAGVAVAAPTDWRYYDTVYTERYMRTPKENPTGYDDNPITRAPKLQGALLLCHGTADDNVHPQNVYEYAEALVQADKDFKENFYTNRNHSIYGGNTRNHLLRQIVQWMEEHLK